MFCSFTLWHQYFNSCVIDDQFVFYHAFLKAHIQVTHCLFIAGNTWYVKYIFEMLYCKAKIVKK